MFKFLSIVLLIVVSFQGDSATLLPNDNVLTLSEPVQIPLQITLSKWTQHIKDFTDLIDLDKIVGVIFGYLNDPEVLNFLTFVLSDDFKKVIWEFENIAEFKEAFKFLSDKGYDVESVIDFINNSLELPPFEKPKRSIARTGQGMTGLIVDLIAALPMEDFKKLFESKLETDPEVAELFETINSPEFLDILRRMGTNPKFEEIKTIFEGYGFDFKYLCEIAKDIFGDYYQGIFCG